jgi:starch synthase (maltosyl-transferring)
VARLRRKTDSSSGDDAPSPKTSSKSTASASITTAPADGTLDIAEGRARAVVDAVLPIIDGGRFAVKSIAGRPFAVTAHCFTDSHDKLRVVLKWQPVAAAEAHEVEMQAAPNDVWTAEFTPPSPGRYRYAVVAWVDHLETWRNELKRREDRADIAVALLVGSALIEEAAVRATGSDATILKEWAAQLRASRDSADTDSVKALALDPARAAIAGRFADRSLAATRSLELIVDRKRAEYSSWYELFPRSAAADPGRHGTFRDVEARLPYIAELGFDVLYFPPIHPIGRMNRKGKNNSLKANPDDVGSPWAIGAAEGGHKDILPDLGSLADFGHLIAQAHEHGIEIAMDIAFQCAPDHPYVSEHPEWFKRRPDGSVQYAENPPKKYQDIYPFDFESRDWRALWNELKSVVAYWVEQGVRILRVDNPHTKPFAFWEWLIGEIKRDHPDVIFLAEAFTRPKVMHRLAKLGFSQSYTYFTWRNSKYDLTEYFTELSQGPGRDYYRPNVWPNTPDILPDTLQTGLRAMYAARLVLAATLSANYGIYGPAFELMESAPREHGSEEYLDSEKYQLRQWQLGRPDSLYSLIARMNRIRRENSALHSNDTLNFCRIDSDQLIAYLKMDSAGSNVILTIVNLDPYSAQSGWVDLDIEALDFSADQPYQVHDLLSDQRFVWRGRRNYVLLEPHRAPAHVFRLRRRVRSEQDFDYYI